MVYIMSLSCMHDIIPMKLLKGRISHQRCIQSTVGYISTLRSYDLIIFIISMLLHAPGCV